MFVFLVSRKVVLVKICPSSEDISEYKMLIVLRCLVQLLHPSQKFERPPFWNGCSYCIKNYGVEVAFYGTTSLLNFIKIYQLVHTLM
jgi:hypothetical protein